MKTLPAFLILCVFAFWLPNFRLKPSFSGHDDFPGWDAAPLPTTGHVQTIPLSGRDARFAAGFPGKIAAFTDGNRTWVVRWLHKPTRKLHPAIDCLRATGYRVQSPGIMAAPDGMRWGTMLAAHNGRSVRVRERIVDPSARGWTDVSAWFWDAALGRSPGPWWAITEFGPHAAE